MTKEQYETFKTIVEKKGYKLSNARGTIHSEHFYYYKGFAYPDEEDAHPGYQIIFLVWDHSEYIREGLDDYIFGVSPLILTSSDEWQRIDLQITEQNFDVDKVEDFACVFYHSFINKEKPVGWSEEDEQYVKDTLALIGFGLSTHSIGQVQEWLQSLKDRISPKKPNPYSGTSFEYNGHTWGMCARDGGVEILIDGELKTRVFVELIK